MSSVSRLRGQARRSRQALTAAHRQAQAIVREHIQDCPRCKTAGADVFKRCDWGWELAKVELRAQRKVEHYDIDHEDKQGGLW